MKDLKIYNVYNEDPSQEMEEEVEKDFYEILDEAENLFTHYGIRLSREEQIYDVIMNQNEEVIAASTLGSYGTYGEDGEDDLTLRFSLVVSSPFRRQGLARKLVKNLIDDTVTDYEGEAILEAWVVNPNLVPLLLSLGFEPSLDTEWSIDAPIMRKVYYY